MATTLKTIFSLFFILITSQAFSQKLGFEDLLLQAPDKTTVFCVPNNEQNETTLAIDDITVKFSSQNWLFISTTPRWIDNHIKDGTLTDFYFETAPPAALSDTARVWHNVNDVHNGAAPLSIPYTGANVIVGIVDQGLDYDHPDFIDANGNTRVLRYWDHTMAGPNSPMPYGYGQLWDSTAINNGTCTSTEGTTAHGTSVTGIATGNANANGTNRGMAPDANIVVVESNFSLPNWTLTIADAVDYIFKVADTLGMPAVVNLSLGSYYGSHDGNDPAAEMMETLLDEKGGRIVVCATGNSGAQGAYHQQSTVTSDTNFVWFVDNPSQAFGANKLFFDLWSDTPDANWDFALGADSPGYSFRGRTNFHGAQSSMGVTILDTIYNGVNRIATLEAYTEYVGGNYHLQILATLDSLDYLYRFETTGSGNYDLWSGGWAGYNDMVTTLPTVGQMPDIVYYVMPDSDQTIVSSWNCSEKVVSVGNFRNRLGHIDYNMNPYVNAATTPGDISPNSSRGPSRHNLTKPDVAASGDVSLSAGPLWLLGNPAYNSLIDSGGWHVRNGGTSMASPIISGIAALYLERCRYANYAQFLVDLKATSYTDMYTGFVPNNTFGYGKPSAFDLLQELTLETQPTISYNSGTSILSSPSTNYQWYLDGNEIQGESNQEHSPQPPYGSYTVMTINDDGCFSVSDPLVITAGIESLEPSPIRAYPNPGQNIIYLDIDDEILRIVAVDMNGKAIELNRSSGGFDVRNLSSGQYSLYIECQEKTYNAKFLRQ